MTPDEYRSKWGLPRDYPMVAPNYAKARSELAKRMGLGRKAGDAPARSAGASAPRSSRAPAKYEKRPAVAGRFVFGVASKR